MKVKEVVKRYRQAVSLAQECLNAQSSGLPDSEAVQRLACAILGADLASGGKVTGVNRAGADSDQDSMLSEAYATRQGDAGGNF